MQWTLGREVLIGVKLGLFAEPPHVCQCSVCYHALSISCRHLTICTNSQYTRGHLGLPLRKACENLLTSCAAAHNLLTICPAVGL